jgi:hypothetical protein
MAATAQHERGAPWHARRDIRTAALAALIVFLLAAAAGRITASPGPAGPEVRPASAASSHLQLPQLANAAPLPGLAAAVKKPSTALKTAVNKRPTPAKKQPHRPPAPVVITGSG